MRLGMRLRGGKQWTLEPVKPPKPRAALIRRDACDATSSELIELLNGGYDDTSAATELNRCGHRDSRGDRFTRSNVMGIRQKNHLPGSISFRCQQLRDRGYCTASDLGAQLGTSASAVYMRAHCNQGIHASSFKVVKRKFFMYKLSSGNSR